MCALFTTSLPRAERASHSLLWSRSPEYELLGIRRHTTPKPRGPSDRQYGQSISTVKRMALIFFTRTPLPQHNS
jgi:hypothetical protein